MTRINVELDGMAQLIAKLTALGENANDILEQVKFDLAFDTQALAITGINRGPKSGKTYQRKNVTHTASAPGQYPASDTGRLANSVGVASDIRDRGASITVGTAVAYGPMLEFGTSRMAARPWLVPSFKKAKIGVEKELRARLEARL